MAGESFGQRIDIAQRIAQKAKTPSINAPTEALNQGSCWRRMGDSTYFPVALMKTGFCFAKSLSRPLGRKSMLLIVLVKSSV